jgi:hypothetical protein
MNILSKDYANVQELVVDESSNTPCPFIFSNKLVNTVSIDSTFYISNDNTYALLERKNILNMLMLDKHININSTLFVKKISLLDVPIGQYILSLNGYNCGTAAYNSDTKIYEFDFAKKKSNQLSILMSKISGIDQETGNIVIPSNPCKIDLVTGHMSGTDFDTDTHINSDNHLLLSRIDCININACNAKLNQKHIIQLESDKTTHKLEVYPYNTFSLRITMPTDSIDIKTDSDDGFIILKIYAGLCEEYNFKFKSSTQKSRIKFGDTFLKVQGLANKYLSEYINKNTLNMSNVSRISLVIIDCKITELYQNYYNIYSYPDRELRIE